MARYSVWSWKRGQWRVYSSERDSGMFDPSPKRVRPPANGCGVAIETALVDLPNDARFVGWSEHAEGRIATDQAARQENRARLPEGLGAVSSGAAGFGAWTPATKSFALAGLALVGGVALAAVIVKAGASFASERDKRGRRRRRNVRLRPGQKWTRGSGEAWKACSACARPMGPFASVQAAEAHSDLCRRCDDLESATTGVFSAKTGKRVANRGRARSRRRNPRPGRGIEYVLVSRRGQPMRRSHEVDYLIGDAIKYADEPGWNGTYIVADNGYRRWVVWPRAALGGGCEAFGLRCKK